MRLEALLATGLALATQSDAIKSSLSHNNRLAQKIRYNNEFGSRFSNKVHAKFHNKFNSKYDSILDDSEPVPGSWNSDDLDQKLELFLLFIEFFEEEAIDDLDALEDPLLPPQILRRSIDDEDPLLHAILFDRRGISHDQMTAELVRRKFDLKTKTPVDAETRKAQIAKHADEAARAADAYWKKYKELTLNTQTSEAAKMAAEYRQKYDELNGNSKAGDDTKKINLPKRSHIDTFYY